METSEGLDGLTCAQVEERLCRFGPNIVSAPRLRTVVDIARHTLQEPMFLLLLAAAALYLIVGDLAEGLFLSAGALLSFSLVIFQEARSERALRALNALAEPRALVIRDGQSQSIPALGLVPGDLIILAEGGRVPADAVLIAGDALQVDESALTGESASAIKKPFIGPGLIELSSPGEDLTASLFAATVIVRGQGVAQVVSTGGATHVGRIGLELGKIVEDPTLLQRDIRRLIRSLGVLSLLFCLVVAIVYGLMRGDWFGGALSGLTLAISLIPEEFPMVMTIFMALGALRLARRKVLVRRGAVIETLGATTLLCVDKTGTLTENRMSLRSIWQKGQRCELAAGISSDARGLLSAAQLASAVRPNDPMDIAVLAALNTAPAGNPIRSYPLRPDFLVFVQVWPANGAVIYAAKGAPEAILALCESADPCVAAAGPAAHALGESGLRVLGVATATFAADPLLPPNELSYRFEGLLGFEDPVREDVPQALAEALRAGVGVAMITGDSPATALAAATIAGISTEGVVTGKDMVAGCEVSLNTRVFARITPTQKLDLVQRFKKSGEVVAMTGDGINDSPALAAADIGIAMGRRGTDVAREAADLILLDDRFSSIIGGIALGRRIFANLRRAMIYITAIHVPVAGLALVPILLGLPPLLYPMHLVLLELLIDPLCSLVFEGEPSEPDAMKKAPRKVSEALFGRRQLSIALAQGLILLAAVLGLYVWLIQSGSDEGIARASAFIALVTGHLSLAIAESSVIGSRLFSRDRIIFWVIVAGATIVMSAAVTVSFLLEILRFQAPPALLLLGSVAVGLIGGGWWSLASHLRMRHSHGAPLVTCARP